MWRHVIMTVVIGSLWSNISECRAQSDLLKRIKSVQAIPVWQRPQRSNAEMRQLLKELQSTKTGEMQKAIEQIALTRPVPAAADTVINETAAVARKTRDKFATAMAFEIKLHWSDAKKAAETLQIAQRNGGLHYLEQMIVRGTAAQAGAPLIAAAYSGNAQAAKLVGQYWAKSSIPGKRAILILGPVVAPELARQLNTDDRSAHMQLAELLGKVGTEKQLPPLESLPAKADPNLRRRVEAAIKEIRSRIANES